MSVCTASAMLNMATRMAGLLETQPLQAINIEQHSILRESDSDLVYRIPNRPVVYIKEVIYQLQLSVKLNVFDPVWLPLT